MPEHIAVSNLMKHFHEHKILTDCQHGLRSKLSCETQLLSLAQELHEQLENKTQIDMSVLDFSKSSHKVAKHRLFVKLDNYGVGGSLHQWIASILLDRKQCVVVHGEASEWVKMEVQHTPRDSAWPNTLSRLHQQLTQVNSKVRLFADDCYMYRPITSGNHVCNLLREDIDQLSCWEQKWCMYHNTSSVSSMLRGNHKL